MKLIILACLAVSLSGCTAMIDGGLKWEDFNQRHNAYQHDQPYNPYNNVMNEK